MVDSMEDGRRVAVGFIGREGIVDINVVLGGVVTPDKAIVQVAGGCDDPQDHELLPNVGHGH